MSAASRDPADTEAQPRREPETALTADRVRGRVVHVTTTDISLDLLLRPQLRAFRDAGYEVITASAPGPHVEALEDDGFRHVPLRHATRSVAPLRDARALAELWRLFRDLEPDIVHTHNPKPGVYGRIAARAAGVPGVVNTQHGLYAVPDDPLGRRAVVYGLERLAAGCSDAELVQSSEDLATLASLGVPARKLHLLGNGIDLTRFDPATLDADRVQALRAEIGAGPDTVVVGAVGRLVREKGYQELFEAAAAVKEPCPQARFVVAGPDEPDKADAISRREMDRARELGVVFLGMVDDVVNLYGALDVYVLASHREGFPRSAMEAAAMGLPVVATDIRGCRQVVDDGTTGRLVPVGDGAALADAVIGLVEDPSARTEIGRAGRDKARAEFDQQAVIDTTLRIYEVLLDRQTRRRRPRAVPAGEAAGGTIRVLWLIKGLGPGGAERLLVNQAAVSSEGIAYEAAYLVPAKNHLVPELDALGVPAVCLGDRPGWAWPLRLWRLLRRHPVDVVHVHSPLPAAAVRVLARGLGRHRPAIVYTEHNEWDRYRTLTRWANRATYGLDDTQIAVSEAVRQSIPPSRRVSVEALTHGVDVDAVRAHLDHRDEARAEMGAGPDDVVIGTVANLLPKKRYDVLMQAARIVLDRSARCRFVTIGQGPMADQVAEWHRELGLGVRFGLLGYRPDVPRVMAGFDIFALSSDHEGLPVAIMEAMAQGLPVVSTDVGGVSEAVRNGVEGRLVPPADPPRLAEALLDLAEDDRARRTASRAAFERVQDFDVAHVCRRLTKTYSEVSSGRGRRESKLNHRPPC